MLNSANRPRLLAIVAVAALGCGGGAASPNPAPAPAAAQGSVPLAPAIFFVPGETMRWQLSLRGIVGGEARMAIGEPGVLDGKQVVISKSRTETVGLVAAIKKVQDDVVTHIDVMRGTPVYHHADVVFGDKQAIIESHFGDGKADVRYQRSGRSARNYRMRLPSGHALFEAHTMLMALRSWEPAPGQRAHFYIAAGRRLWRNDLQAVGVEEVRTSLGTFEALRIEGVARRKRRNLSDDPRKKPRPFTLWISTDDERRPLLVTGRVELGEVRAELVEHHVPSQRVAYRR